MTSCPSCSTENLDDARYCASCGRDLAGSVIAAPEPGMIAPAVAYASWGKRLLAVIIDAVLIGIVAGILARVMDVKTNSISQVISIVYAIVMLGGVGGATIGKKAMKIKVVKLDLSPVSYGTAALREIVGKFVSAIILGIGFLFPLWDAKKQALHDKIAGTLVIRTD